MLVDEEADLTEFRIPVGWAAGLAVHRPSLFGIQEKESYALPSWGIQQVGQRQAKLSSISFAVRPPTPAVWLANWLVQFNLHCEGSYLRSLPASAA